MNAAWKKKFYSAFGEKIKEAREAKGWTLHQLATATSQQFNTIRRIEEGEGCHLYHIVWISDVLGLSIDKLILDLASITRVEARLETKLRKTRIDTMRKVQRDIQKEIDDLV